MDTAKTYTAFSGNRRLSTGTLERVLREVKKYLDSRRPGVRNNSRQVLVFCDQTGKQVDFDLRGDILEVLRKALPVPTRVGPGRPRLGVVSREISLLPRHWEWLEEQPNGASAALRRLIDEARRGESSEAMLRARIDAVGRIMTVLAGNLPGFEEGCRSLYRRDLALLTECVKNWPPDIRSYILEHVELEPKHEGSDSSAS